MKLSWLSIISIFVISIIVFYMTISPGKDSSNFNCRTNFVISNYGLNAFIVATIKSENNIGVVSYDGPVYNGDTKIGYFNRKVYFTINKESKFYLLTSSSIYNMETDHTSQEVAEKILPDFFVLRNAKIYFDIVNEGQGYIFIKDNIPMFYCRKLN